MFTKLDTVQYGLGCTNFDDVALEGRTYLETSKGHVLFVVATKWAIAMQATARNWLVLIRRLASDWHHSHSIP